MMAVSPRVGFNAIEPREFGIVFAHVPFEVALGIALRYTDLLGFAFEVVATCPSVAGDEAIATCEVLLHSFLHSIERNCPDFEPRIHIQPLRYLISKRLLFNA